MVRGAHQPLITQEMFDTVQDVLTGRSRTARPARPCTRSSLCVSLYAVVNAAEA